MNMPRDWHWGSDPFGAPTAHSGLLDSCPAAECRDAVLETLMETAGHRFKVGSPVQLTADLRGSCPLQGLDGSEEVIRYDVPAGTTGTVKGLEPHPTDRIYAVELPDIGLLCLPEGLLEAV